MAIQANYTPAQVTEYWDAYQGVKDAAKSGYHKPYNNMHDDSRLGEAYACGFNDAVDNLARGGHA